MLRKNLANSVFFLLIAICFLLFALSGCANKDVNKEKPPLPETPIKEDAPKEPLAKEPLPPKDILQEDKPQNNNDKIPINEEKPKTAQDQEKDEAKRLLEEFQQKIPLEEQQNRFESQKLYEMALSYYKQQDFEKAKELVQKAIEKYPKNYEAMKLLNSINEILSRSSDLPSFTQEQIRQKKVVIEQMQAEIRDLINKGKSFYDTGHFEEAIEGLKEAEIKLEGAPDYIPIKDLLPRIRDMIKKAEEGKEIRKKQKDELQRKQAENEIKWLEEAEKREIVSKIKDLLNLAYTNVELKRYDRAIDFCNEILIIDPHYRAAQELKEDAQSARHRYEYHKYLMNKIDRWKQMRNQDGEAVIPYSEYVRFPDRRTWEEIKKRGAETLLKITGSGEDDPEIKAIENKLNSTRLSLSFERAKIEQIIDYIRDSTGLNINISDAIKAARAADFDRELPNFKVNDLTVKNILKILLQQLNLDYTIKPGGVILITDSAGASGELLLEIYDIRDILFKIRDFPAPPIDISTTPFSDPSRARPTPWPRPWAAPTEPRAQIGDEGMVRDLIEKNVAGGKLVELGGAIDIMPNGLMNVNAPRRVHKEIQEFMKKLRSYAGLMVSVQAKFFSVYDDFLDEIGINITPDIQITGNQWDLTAGTDQQTGAGTEFPMDLTHPGGVGLARAGGLNAQFSLLGQRQLQLVINALHKNSHSTLLQSPHVTSFNGQRAHILVLTQRSYIVDEVMTPTGLPGMGMMDPILSVLDLGTVLDIRPLISNDKKFVRMEVRLYQASLISLVPMMEIPTIQEPTITFQRAESVVIAPDRGTVLISGFKNITEREMEAKTPFLGEIPILDFFFKRKQRVNEHQNELILVTPRIIDLGEEEEKLK